MQRRDGEISALGLYRLGFKRYEMAAEFGCLDTSGVSLEDVLAGL